MKKKLHFEFDGRKLNSHINFKKINKDIDNPKSIISKQFRLKTIFWGKNLSILHGL